MTSGRATAILLTSAALLATGCGATTYVRAPDRRVDVTLDEYRVVPEHVVVRAGDVTFVARDTGRLTHNLVVAQFAHPTPGEKERHYGSPTKTLFPGQTSAPVVVHLEPGRYRLICTIGNHDNLGQYAILEVVR